MNTKFEFTVIVERKENSEVMAECNFRGYSDARDCFRWNESHTDSTKFRVSFWDNEEENCLMQTE